MSGPIQDKDTLHQRGYSTMKEGARVIDSRLTTYKEADAALGLGTVFSDDGIWRENDPVWILVMEGDQKAPDMPSEVRTHVYIANAVDGSFDISMALSPQAKDSILNTIRELPDKDGELKITPRERYVEPPMPPKRTTPTPIP